MKIEFIPDYTPIHLGNFGLCYYLISAHESVLSEFEEIKSQNGKVLYAHCVERRNRAAVQIMAYESKLVVPKDLISLILDLSGRIKVEPQLTSMMKVCGIELVSQQMIEMNTRMMPRFPELCSAFDEVICFHTKNPGLVSTFTAAAFQIATK